MTVIGVANPLVKGAYRNRACPCGSGKKTKKCHGQDLVITKEQFDVVVNLENKRNEEFTAALKDVANKAKAFGEKDETKIST